MNNLINSEYRGRILTQLEIRDLSILHIAIAMLGTIQIYKGGDLRISWNGVPHLVYPNNIKPQYSIAYFKREKLYKVFYPYPSNRGEQKRLNFSTKEEVINYLNQNEK